ncbi:MAG: hypothetical protein WB561_13155 [Terracidiphilus sp.]
MKKHEVLLEGLSEGEILQLPIREIDELILIGEPIVFRAGSASILGSFSVDKSRLVIELAQIDGGGEGVLVSLGSLVQRFAATRGLSTIEWRVHAVSCAKPNLKLRSVLERRGFEIKQIPRIGEVYHLVETRPNAPTQ